MIKGVKLLNMCGGFVSSYVAICVYAKDNIYSSKSMKFYMYYFYDLLSVWNFIFCCFRFMQVMLVKNVTNCIVYLYYQHVIIIWTKMGYFDIWIPIWEP